MCRKDIILCKANLKAKSPETVKHITLVHPALILFSYSKLVAALYFVKSQFPYRTGNPFGLFLALPSPHIKFCKHLSGDVCAVSLRFEQYPQLCK